ncbi:MAG: hypothetical protein WC657_06965 [Candidatus Paceibacterota bacterium]
MPAKEIAKLQPCPFCAGTARLTPSLIDGFPDCVICDCCGATVCDSPAEGLSATEQWNRRASIMDIIYALARDMS